MEDTFERENTHDEIAEIIRELNAISPGYKVRVVMKEMDLENQEQNLDEEIVHRLFFEYSKKYPEIFEEFSFNTTGTYPFSHLLERILQRMKIPLVLKTVNPSYENMKLVKGTNEYVEEKIISRMDSEEYEVLQSLGKELKKRSQYGECCMV